MPALCGLPLPSTSGHHDDGHAGGSARGTYAGSSHARSVRPPLPSLRPTRADPPPLRAAWPQGPPFLLADPSHRAQLTRSHTGCRRRRWSLRQDEPAQRVRQGRVPRGACLAPSSCATRARSPRTVADSLDGALAMQGYEPTVFENHCVDLGKSSFGKAPPPSPDSSGPASSLVRPMRPRADGTNSSCRLRCLAHELTPPPSSRSCRRALHRALAVGHGRAGGL